MMLLALDPGHWTGWAILRQEPETAHLIAAGQFRLEEVDAHLRALSVWSKMFEVKDWLVEDTPIMSPDASTMEVVAAVLYAAADNGVNVHRVKPFQWKFLKRILQVPTFKHCTEATQMGMAFLQRLQVSE